MTIYFYTPHDEPYGCFSNFSRHGIEMDGIWWQTVEHYFQAQKFAGTPHAAQIQRALTPKQAAEIGRNRKLPLRPDWEQVKDEVMFKAVLQKFETHKGLRTLLLSTGEEEIVESAPGDYYWGCGADGSGQNTLGKLLMEVRSMLRQRATQERSLEKSDRKMRG
ncbi:NADAR family protein [Ktedonobacteria bacterium brp13]|nr:NADAR family protein [Ktedonobacteria bacterium brp13]BCL79161.1 NADAR family protein [Ktedonobacteria bacterium brp13]BCL80916.1 NADAR family protein [Ktedonobacteria bacterium brp13]BCL83574.1 NADAR family protein [Ktedonobacteria bacterium brp13]